ncbi:MFS transporter [Kribbella sandramycini]|uniref:MFS transporter n=1 Tax=Kribbella sandramycini TaxID=60450 RepID=A0A7Y4NYQ9_9ACTN|nr:MFS transporter [Kribbella sandramycini]MBB6567305.1 DHA2 family multidrug resistance protein-like MFS transporter [Kribbella sandramycini]NOL40083.1 MFS transporter [Kribbella sandramycini]
MTTTVRQRNPRLALALLALPSLLIAIDISVLGVALPRMSADLRPSPAELLWMNDIYGFMVGGTMITMGAVGDRIGRRRLIVLCAAVFALASAAAAFATEPWMIIATRAVMGLAGAAIMPASMALIAQLFPDPKQRVSAMGAYMTCFLTGMALAPLLGGVLLQYWWWGSVFLLGVPVMVLTVAAAPRLLPESEPQPDAHLDLRSAALCLTSILSLVAALKWAVNGAPLWQTAGLGVVGFVLGVVFVRRQHTLEHPLLDLSLLRQPGVSRALWVLFLTALLMGGTSIFAGFYLQSVRGLSPLTAAVCLIPSMLAMIAASNLGPWLGHRYPPQRVVLGGLVVMAAGFVPFAVLPVGGAGIAVLIAGGVLTTAGIGAAFPFLMNDIISHAPQDRAGSAASLAQTANEIGIATGLVILGSLATVVYRARLSATGSWVDGFEQTDPAVLGQVRRAFLDGYHAVGLVGVATMLLVLVLFRARRA